MKTLSPALEAHLGAEVTTLTTCWKLTRRDGLLLGFTELDTALVFEGDTYLANSGMRPSAITSSAGFAVDNLDIEGVIDAELMTEADILSGRYDYAEIEI